jgi:glycosyltransferase involved in cell wall biosynthesis
MKIGVELYQIVEGATGGLVPLLQGVLEALFAGWPEHEVVLFCTPENQRLFPTVPPHVQRLVLPRELYLPLLDAQAAFLGLDVLLSSYPMDLEFAFPESRRVVLIPDCQHEYFPEFFTAEVLRARRRAFARALRNAGAIATLSEHARQTLRDHPETRCSDIFLLPPALRTEGKPLSVADLTATERDQLPAGDFFYYPANLWPHKNHYRILQAFERFLKETGRPFEFIFTGHPEGWNGLARMFPGLPVRHLGFVRRGFLQVLLARARAMPFFSLFEGFGMPLLEAFAVGTPVACSNTTSLPETGGDAVVTCDPTDPAAMSALLARLVTDQPLRERLVARGKERLARFSWRASAGELVAACERLTARNSAPVQSPLQACQSLTRLVQEIEADRAARLDVIHRLDDALQEANRRLQVLNCPPVDPVARGRPRTSQEPPPVPVPLKSEPSPSWKRMARTVLRPLVRAVRGASRNLRKLGRRPAAGAEVGSKAS